MRYADEYKWSWVDNPFIGTHELNGLKILMMLTSNWDAKDARDDGGNTAVFQSRKLGPLLYGVDDWGASMGKWGGFFRRDKWDCAGYQSDTPNFVKGVKGGFIEWGFSGKHADDITHGIRVEDVIWLNTHLSRVTNRHLRAGLKASGATPLEIDCFTKAIRARIKQLREVASRHRETGERGHLSLSTKASTRSVQKNHFTPELLERDSSLAKKFPLTPPPRDQPSRRAGVLTSRQPEKTRLACNISPLSDFFPFHDLLFVSYLLINLGHSVWTFACSLLIAHCHLDRFREKRERRDNPCEVTAPNAEAL
jgi:hypothetical protein